MNSYIALESHAQHLAQDPRLQGAAIIPDDALLTNKYHPIRGGVLLVPDGYRVSKADPVGVWVGWGGTVEWGGSSE